MTPNTVSLEDFLQHQTEAYALQLAKEEANWHAQYELREQELLAQVDALLAKQSMDAGLELLDLFRAPDMHDAFANRNEISQIYILVNIFQRECMAGIESTILSCINSCRAFFDLYRDLKFLFWRIEFGNEKDAAGNPVDIPSRLMETIDAKPISGLALGLMITSTCIQPANMMMLVADWLLKTQQLERLFQLLSYYHELYPDNQDVSDMLEDLRQILKQS